MYGETARNRAKIDPAWPRREGKMNHLYQCEAAVNEKIKKMHIPHVSGDDFFLYCKACLMLQRNVAAGMITL